MTFVEGDLELCVFSQTIPFMPFHNDLCEGVDDDDVSQMPSEWY